MAEETTPLFIEKQYLGYNQLSMLRRLSLALFCFGLYWWKVTNNHNGDLFFLLGVVIIVISIILLFVLHLKIRVFKTGDGDNRAAEAFGFHACARGHIQR